MRVLIVEDDQYKCEAVESLLSSMRPGCQFTVCKSVQSAVVSVGEADFDLIVLDMSLPSHELDSGGALGIPRLSGGVELLFELNYINKFPPVIILTQFPEIEMSNQLVPLDEVSDFVSDNFGISISSCVYYEFENIDWHEQFLKGIPE